VNKKLAALMSIPNSLLKVQDNKLYLGKLSAEELLDKYGSPLYVYQENVLRDRCRQLVKMVGYPQMIVHYSAKANINVALMKIVREEGLHVDAMSLGEIFLQMAAGFPAEKIFFVCNNVDDEELQYAIERGIKVSVDSLSQLERFGRLNPGGKVAVRINPGIGSGHHEKVVTGGDKSKFGVYYTDVDKIKEIAQKYNLKIMGINMHIGSNFLSPEPYIQAVETLLKIAEQFEDLELVDAGGGFGISYDGSQPPLDLAVLGARLTEIYKNWTDQYGKKITFAMEPGRYVIAESGILLTRALTLKSNPGNPPRTFIGTDAGFNVLARPVMYDSYHEILNASNIESSTTVIVDICGNVCESGDLLARERKLNPTKEGDAIAVLDAGAYGFSMASNYNCRLRPAEVLIEEDGQDKLIRAKDTLEDLLRHQIY